MLVDTHCHIQSAGSKRGEAHTVARWDRLGLSSDQIYDQSVEAGVKQLICVGCDLDDSDLAAQFAASHEGCYGAVGVHPHEAKNYLADEAFSTKLMNLSQQPKVVAIGECGLDYYYSHSEHDIQKQLLVAQLEVAKSCQLPVIFHVREAFSDFWPIYDQFKLPGVLHSFSDNEDNLKQALERGLFIGVNGIVSFTKEPAVYKLVPLDKLVLETDAPFLAPAPVRGKVNEPQHLIHVLQFLAQLRGETVGEIEKSTTTNAKELFGL